MENITPFPLSLEFAKQIYGTASEPVRAELFKYFGVMLMTTCAMDKWKSFLKENNLDIALPYPEPTDADELWDNSCVMLRHIIKVKRKDWVPAFTPGEKRWIPIFYMGVAGFGFTYTTYDHTGTNTNTIVGSRLSLPTSKLAEEVGRKYLSIYEIYHTK